MDDDAGTRRYAKGVARREQLLDAAYQVFGEVGFHGASLRQIAARAGVSHQSLMHYFPTKDELLLAVLRRRDERLARTFDDPSGLPLGELVAMAADNRAVPGMVELFMSASGEATSPAHPAHEYYRDYYASIVDAAERALADRADHADANAVAVADADADADADAGAGAGWTPEQVAQVVLAAMDGLQLQWLYDGSIDVPDLLDRLIRTLLRSR